MATATPKAIQYTVLLRRATVVVVVVEAATGVSMTGVAIAVSMVTGGLVSVECARATGGKERERERGGCVQRRRVGNPRGLSRFV